MRRKGEKEEKGGEGGIRGKREGDDVKLRETEKLSFCGMVLVGWCYVMVRVPKDMHRLQQRREAPLNDVTVPKTTSPSDACAVSALLRLAVVHD